ncbi:MAG TPA: biopolymer transporter ExbD [Candidatus Acidoferrales bacterium]|nr:biopolymer transporter ExbD [Candidatus Acidoferrales bacterium]
MGLTAAQGDDQVMAEINITPFTDVLLVLLIIFMILAALVTPPGFQKELPNHSDPSQTNNDDPKKTIDVEVTEKNVIYVDGQQANAQSIYYIMAQDAQKRGHLHVSITADGKAQYGIIIRILDAAKLANLNDVGFVTS